MAQFYSAVDTQRDHMYVNRIRTIFDRLTEIGILSAASQNGPVTAAMATG